MEKDNSPKLAWIYLCQIGYDGLFKIGVTTDLAVREKQLSISIPHLPIQFIGFCYTNKSHERMLHNMFRSFKDESLVDFTGGSEVFLFELSTIELIKTIFALLHIGFSFSSLEVCPIEKNRPIIHSAWTARKINSTKELPYSIEDSIRF